MTSASSSIDDLTIENVRDAYRAIEYYYEQGWTDGLPVVPPTAEKVQEFVDYVGRDPREVVAEMSHLDRQCTVELAAINAVMAGCLKEYFPVVLANLACFKNGFALVQSTTPRAESGSWIDRTAAYADGRPSFGVASTLKVASWRCSSA